MLIVRLARELMLVPQQNMNTDPTRDAGPPKPGLTELADNNCNDQESEDCNDGDGDYPICSHPVSSSSAWLLRVGERAIDKVHYLRAIPLRVLTLRSTYPSDSSSVPRVCSMTDRCECKSASVLAPICSVSLAIL